MEEWAAVGRRARSPSCCSESVDLSRFETTMLRRRTSASLHVLILATMWISVRAWINTYKSDIHPEYPGSCYDADSGAILTPGVTMRMAGDVGRPPGEHCVSKTCIRAPGHSTRNDAQSELFVKVERCTPIEETDGCEMIPGLEDVVYPGCCPRLKCSPPTEPSLDSPTLSSAIESR